MGVLQYDRDEAEAMASTSTQRAWHVWCDRSEGLMLFPHDTLKFPGTAAGACPNMVQVLCCCTACKRRKHVRERLMSLPDFEHHATGARSADALGNIHMKVEPCIAGAPNVAMSLSRWLESINWTGRFVMARDPARVHPATAPATGGASPRQGQQQQKQKQKQEQQLRAASLSPKGRGSGGMAASPLRAAASEPQTHLQARGIGEGGAASAGPKVPAAAAAMARAAGDRGETHSQPRTEAAAAAVAQAQQGARQQQHEGQRRRRPAITWSPDVNERFEVAVQQLGAVEAKPVAIMQVMGAEGITRSQVASQLHRYRKRLQATATDGVGTAPAMRHSPPQGVGSAAGHGVTHRSGAPGAPAGVGGTRSGAGSDSGRVEQQPEDRQLRRQRRQQRGTAATPAGAMAAHEQPQRPAAPLSTPGVRTRHLQAQEQQVQQQQSLAAAQSGGPAAHVKQPQQQPATVVSPPSVRTRHQRQVEQVQETGPGKKRRTKPQAPLQQQQQQQQQQPRQAEPLAIKQAPGKRRRRGLAASGVSEGLTPGKEATGLASEGAPKQGLEHAAAEQPVSAAAVKRPKRQAQEEALGGPSPEAAVKRRARQAQDEALAGSPPGAAVKRPKRQAQEEALGGPSPEAAVKRRTRQAQDQALAGPPLEAAADGRRLASPKPVVAASPAGGTRRATRAAAGRGD